MAVHTSYHGARGSSTGTRAKRLPRSLFSHARQLSIPAVDAVELRALGEAFGQSMRERLSGRWCWYPWPSRGPRCASREDLRGRVFFWTREADGYVSWTCAPLRRRRGPGRPPLARSPRLQRFRVLRPAAPCYPGAELVAEDRCDEARPVWGRARRCPLAVVRCAGGLA